MSKAKSQQRYARLMGDFWRHDRTAALSPAAAGILCRAWSYAAEQMTDGYVPRHILAAFFRGAIDESVVDEIASAGLWKTSRAGFQCRDWSQRNITREGWEKHKEGIKTRVAKHRAKADVTPTEAAGNADVTRYTAQVTEASLDEGRRTKDEDPDLATLAQGSSARGSGRVSILVAEFTTALGAVGGAFAAARDDIPHLEKAADAMALVDRRPLRDVAREWLPHFMQEFRSRTPKNLALYAQARAANGGQPITQAQSKGKRDGFQAPADHSQFKATEITDDLFKREAS